MGFFDWLFGRNPRSNRDDKPGDSPGKTPAKPPRPKVLAGLEDDSPFVMLDTGNGMVTMMDREAYEYTYGESQAPDPAQRDLDELLTGITRVRAVAAGMLDGRSQEGPILLDVTAPEALAAFRRCWRIDEDPSTFSHCMCLGGPTLELFHGPELAATIGMQHGRAIRWKKWKHDAVLRNGKALNDWLVANGVPRQRLESIFHSPSMGFALESDPQRKQAEELVKHAEEARRSGDLRQALDDCTQALALDAELAVGHGLRGIIHHERHDYAAAIADCSEAIRLGLRRAEVYFTRGVAFDCLGQPDNALADCTYALEVDPTHVNAWHSRGLIRARLGQFAEARADCTSAIRLNPDWFLPYWTRGMIQHQQGNFDGVIGDYTEVIRLMQSADIPPVIHAVPVAVPSRVQQTDRMSLAAAFLRRASAHEAKEQFAEAAADYDEAVHHDPEFALAFNARGQFRLHRQGQVTEAVADFDQVIRLCPNAAEGFVHRGLARLSLGLDGCILVAQRYARAPDNGVRAVGHNTLDLPARILSKRHCRKQSGHGRSE